ncbi:hypothetical protein FORC82_2813 [Escherichia coli]|jgi:cytochrome bd-type quinol oxidase subunit 1|nr:hypothetical protein G880_02075 [Escherichia coli KOEGE 10 (25a)]QAZ72504.1 hypothetical protein FORC82_2813 [Escherichia coli]RDP65502.1 hypothetical protein C4A51_01948 [Escherichia coli]BBR69160.1 hypothetical protein WP4W18E09_26910 [Escherichia coli]
MYGLDILHLSQTLFTFAISFHIVSPEITNGLAFAEPLSAIASCR